MRSRSKRSPANLLARCHGLGYDADPGARIWAAIELVEAAARTGNRAETVDTCRTFTAMTRASGTDLTAGMASWTSNSRGRAIRGREWRS